MEQRSNNEILLIANEINKQIGWSANLMTQFSWGISQRVGFLYENMPTLGLKVNGFLHKGWVYISLNEGRDNYEIRLLKGNKVIKTIDEVYCDNLGFILDGLIEKESALSDDDYHTKVLQYYAENPV